MTAFFDASDGRVAYRRRPGGTQPVLLVHGLPTAKELWDPVTAHLAPGLATVAVDLLDYGESAKVGRSLTHRQRAATLDELRAHLGWEQFALVAHDLGASVAVDYMGEFGRFVSRLVLLSPPVYPDFVEPFIVKLFRLPGLGEAGVLLLKRAALALAIRRGLVHRDGYSAAFERALLSAYAGAAGRAALMRNLRWGRPHTVFADYPAILRRVTCPTLVIQGRRDPYIPYDHAVRLTRDVADARLVTVEDGAHFLPIDTPQAVAAALNDFLLERQRQ